jgi:hypothetical protein
MKKIRKQLRRWPLVAGVLIVLVSVAVCTVTIGEYFRQKSSVGKPVSQSAASVTTAVGSAGAVVHGNIITTEFSVGEPADSDNGYISNSPSAWLDDWKAAFGGYDDPSARNGYFPASFTPKENPFYFALPYDDLTDGGARKPTAQKCLDASGLSATNYSWCKNAWIRVDYGDKTVYAQWEDVGPFQEDDTAYVFGTAAPRNTEGESAGLDVSPAVTTYLGLDGLNRTQWQFVPTSQVPNGPWKQIITTSSGYTAS